jgi:NTE family protein
VSRLEAQVKAGALHALGISATSYSTGTAMTFYQGSPSIVPWRRARRRGVPVPLTIAHLMASTAIPFIFPAVKLDRDWYMDGGVRQISPLAPALHLGARRVLVIAVGRLAGPAAVNAARAARAAPRYPTFAQTAGHALTSIFLDNLSADLERMMQINRVVSLVAPQELARRGLSERHVDAFVLAPSADISELALKHANRLPGGVRALLRGLGGTRGSGGALTSYLLFEPAFCRALLALGYADAMARREELEAFLGGAAVNYLPLPPPDFD